MILRALFAVAATLSACAEPPPPPVEGGIIARAVKHAQDQVEGGRRPAPADAAAAESEG